MQFDIHASDIARFKKCRRDWHFSSPLRLGLQPNTVYSPFLLGSAVHYGLEQHHKLGLSLGSSALMGFKTHYAKENPGTDLSGENVEKDLFLANQMLVHYSLWQKANRGDFADTLLDFVSLEKKFRIPFYGVDGKRIRGVWLAGRFDGVVRHKETGKLYLWELKTVRSIAERAKMLANDEQTLLYLFAAQHFFDEPIEGILYTLMRKAAPTSAPVLKSGELSQSKSLDTSPYFYIAQLKAHTGYEGQALKTHIGAHYREYVDYLWYEKPNTFFQRVLIEKTPSQLLHFHENLAGVISEMLSKRTKIYPSPNYHCNYCGFREPCLAMNEQDQTKLSAMLANSFTKSKYGTESDE